MGEVVRPLDGEALALFAAKGRIAGSVVPQSGEANAAKVRRVIQLARDLSALPFERLRVLDLGCGEGVYAIEAGLRGADVTAVDARTERMSLGAACAARHGLSNVRFVQEDVRRVTPESMGRFDVVLCLGLLYHLDAPQVLPFLERVHDLCARVLVLETVVASGGGLAIEHAGRTYEGERVREHDDDASAEVRRSRVLKSIDNTFSARLTKPSLVRALHDVGFSSVLECLAPPEPLKPGDRTTIAALRGERVRLSTYPWVNDRSEEEIARRLEGGPT